MTLIKIAACLLIACFLISDARRHRYNDFDVVEYLKKYHYLGAGNPDPLIAELAQSNMTMAVEMGIRMFQMKWGMLETGYLDSATMRKMKAPRCGMPDIEVMEEMPNMDSRMSKMGLIRGKLRNRRYMTQGSKWDRDTLYYRISQYTPDLNPDEVDVEIKRAFQLWSDVTPLDFIQTYGSQVDLDIRFTPASHGDGFDFDGPGGTLAHAFYPQYGGASHFDEDETWTIETYTGINLLQVAAHEFGHALGLRHSDVLGALMYPFYGGYVPDFTLPLDDIRGIQAVYGPRIGNPYPTPKPPTPSPGMPDMCDDVTIDAITTQIINGVSITHVFSGQYYLQIDPNGIVPGFPHLISDDWPGVRHVDAALTLEYEMWRGVWEYRLVTYLFSGDKYYKYVGMQLYDDGYIADDWGLPDNLDAVFQWSGNGKVYAVKGKDVYRISSITDKYPDRDQPHRLGEWGRQLSAVNGAFMATNDRGMRDTILFHEDQYYKIDDTTGQVAPGYPQSTPEGWLGCGENDRNILYFNSV